MTIGLQISDEFGNIVLDTSTITVKDFTIYENSSITTNQTITLPTNNLPAAVEIMVINNTGELDTSSIMPEISLNKTAGTITINGSGAAFNAGIRLIHLE